MPSLLPRKQILFESDVVEQARALRIDDAGTEICLRDSAGQEQALPTEVKAIVLQVLESLQTKTAVNLKPLNKSLTSTEVVQDDRGAGLSFPDRGHRHHGLHSDAVHLVARTRYRLTSSG